MIKLDENLKQIQCLQSELLRCKEKGPHYRELSKRLRKLRQERAQAIKYLKAPGRL